VIESLACIMSGYLALYTNGAASVLPDNLISPCSSKNGANVANWLSWLTLPCVFSWNNVALYPALWYAIALSAFIFSSGVNTPFCFETKTCNNHVN
jgi:hypothetical protein